MADSKAVAQYLPFLRRYARALTGSQGSGDTYVAATLEALIADPSVMDGEGGPRVALYSLFTKIWNSIAVNSAPGGTEPAMPGEQKLANITPLPRQAFLLVALEGFPEGDAARILGIDVVNLRNLIEESGRELAAEIATDVLIIEDETFIAMELEGLVESLGHRVLGVHPCRGYRFDKKEETGPDPGRYPARGRQFGARCGQRTAAVVRGAGDLHYRLSGAFPDRRAAGTGVFDRKAVPTVDGFGDCQPGAVF